MKQILLLALCLTCSVQLSAQFSGKGSGTSDDPYQITNADELFEVRNALSASYKLMNDIDLTEWIQENNPTQGWNPIGNFGGILNGNSKTIYGLFISRPNTDNIGLFECIDKSSQIHDIIISSPIIYGKNNVGCLFGQTQSVSYNASHVASITIINAKINGQNNVGGIGGLCNYAVVTNCQSIFSSVKGKECVGGIMGFYTALIGYLNTPSEYSNFKNQVVIGGSVSGDTNIGGIFGYITSVSYLTTSSENSDYASAIMNNYCSSIVKGEKNVGGIIGCQHADNYSYEYRQSNAHWYTACRASHLNIIGNHFAGKVQSNTEGGGIIGMLDLTTDINDADHRYGTHKVYFYLQNNICSGTIFSKKSTSGILYFSYNKTETKITFLSQNVFCGDSLISEYSDGQIYRISQYQGDNNYALSTSILLIDSQPYTIEEDNAQQGVSYGKKTLMKQSTYEGMGFDFTKDWAIVEGDTYPYNINQCRPATVTSFKSGISGTIEGTAIGKSSNCNGSVYVTIGDNFYEGTVANGQWAIQLGEVREGVEAKVTVVVDGMMPSILATAKAENGTSIPVVDDTPNTDISQLSDVVYIGNTEASTGSQLTLSVKMKNAVTAEGFGFDLYLPDGVTVARDADGFPMVELSTQRTTARKTNSFDAAFQSDGSLRVLAASTNGSAINGNDGEVCLITINIANDMAEGDYPILLKNIAISDVNAVSHRTEQVKSTLTISAYTSGDSNNDGVIDVSDFTATAHYLLGNAPTGFNVKAADANADGVVDVADLTAVAHIILYGSINRPSSAPILNSINPQ